MAAGTPRPPQHTRRRVRFFLGAFLFSWFAVGSWNSMKPPPAGTRIASLPTRLEESQVDFLADSAGRRMILPREIAAVDRAERIIIVDQCPLPRELAQHLLARRQLRPKVKIVVVTDPRNEIYGGTPSHYFTTLEQAGVIVSRVRLERLRDSNPLYSGWWRLVVGWWSNAYDDVPGEATLSSWLRHSNGKADERQLLVADDGAGGWTSILMSSGPRDGAGGVALEVRARLASDVVASELKIADWSSDDDRLPGAPAIEARGLGSIDARFLSEGAIHSGLLDAIGNSNAGDLMQMVAVALGDRRLIDSLLRAAGRRVRVRILLHPDAASNRVVAAELQRRGGGGIEIRWMSGPDRDTGSRFIALRHGGDMWLNLGSADYTRRGLDDFNLAASFELRMPARVGAARAVEEYFAALWASGAPNSGHVDESRSAYWRYRLTEATGLMSD